MKTNEVHITLLAQLSAAARQAFQAESIPNTQFLLGENNLSSDQVNFEVDSINCLEETI
jgi:hypothetical protein